MTEQSQDAVDVQPAPGRRGAWLCSQPGCGDEADRFVLLDRPQRATGLPVVRIARCARHTTERDAIASKPVAGGGWARTVGDDRISLAALAWLATEAGDRRAYLARRQAPPPARRSVVTCCACSTPERPQRASSWLLVDRENLRTGRYPLTLPCCDACREGLIERVEPFAELTVGQPDALPWPLTECSERAEAWLAQPRAERMAAAGAGVIGGVFGTRENGTERPHPGRILDEVVNTSA